jgi:hypothetical protein
MTAWQNRGEQNPTAIATLRQIVLNISKRFWIQNNERHGSETL